MSSYVEREFKFFARSCRLFGCLFVSNSWSGRFAEFRPKFRSWYSLYFGFLGVVGCGFEIILLHRRISYIYMREKDFSELLFMIIHIVIGLNIATNTLVFILGTERLIDILRSTKRLEGAMGFEPAISSRVDDAKKLFKTFLFVVFQAAFVLSRLASSKEIFEEPSTAITVIVTICFSFSSVGYAIHGTVALNANMFFYSVLSEYLKPQVAIIETLSSQILTRNPRYTAKILERTRLHFVSIRNIVRAVDRLFEWGLVVSFLTCAFTLCFTLYSLFDASTSWSKMYIYIIYSVNSSANISELTHAAFRMKQQALHIKHVLEKTPLVNLPRRLVLQVEFFAENIEAEQLCVTGSGFFTVDKPVLTSIAALIFTYSLLLVQTRGFASPEKRHPKPII
ncbi:uncharacterized protein LOC115333098 [Ixodes scapularis]|uniref:uncharacterized protein LOC115333098 n=1 Tax=Ixodes scapularis TaxID=6945 RepID=UPI0011616675|nr:uncharacterized protein LOC115333098 [Ixodes scapularis]